MDDNKRTGLEELRRRQAAGESSGGGNRRPVSNSVRREERRGAIGCLVLVVALLAVGVMALGGDSMFQEVRELMQREYTPFDLVEMADAVNQNPLRAEELYNKQYGMVHGYLDFIGETNGKAAFIITSQKREIVSMGDVLDSLSKGEPSTGQTRNPFDEALYSNNSLPADDPGTGTDESETNESEMGKPGGMMTCIVTDKQQREALLSLSVGDAVTVCGRVVYAQGMYAMEVDSIVLTASAEQGDVPATPGEPQVDWDNSEQLFIGRGGHK